MVVGLFLVPRLNLSTQSSFDALAKVAVIVGPIEPADIEIKPASRKNLDFQDIQDNKDIQFQDELDSFGIPSFKRELRGPRQPGLLRYPVILGDMESQELTDNKEPGEKGLPTPVEAPDLHGEK
ncbi:hypothetical protein GCK72_022501 [Caenorhabditis remanei]|uniref:Uncharacterized protein n=1 Tax=Caenorhabditis remanei TaxID=31234 RepID=A0A6A5FTW1_CAERE|nr:hypothetical protein GCK72_022501 [Caenorhabditis remanei]KAF1746050.1 hypothetical protein GCK72_022501 [Caenorhabditis remanei]